MDSLQEDDILESQIDDFEFQCSDQENENALNEDALLKDDGFDEDFDYDAPSSNTNDVRNAVFINSGRSEIRKASTEEDVLTTNLQEDDFLELEEENDESPNFVHSTAILDQFQDTSVDRSQNNRTPDQDESNARIDVDSEEDEDDDEEDSRNRFKSERQHIPTVETKRVVRHIPDTLDQVDLNDESRAQLEREKHVNNRKNSSQRHRKNFNQNRYQQKGPSNYYENNHQKSANKYANSNTQNQSGGHYNSVPQNLVRISEDLSSQQPQLVPRKIHINPNFKGPLMAQNIDKEFRHQQELSRMLKMGTQQINPPTSSGQQFRSPLNTTESMTYRNESNLRPIFQEQPFQQPARPLMTEHFHHGPPIYPVNMPFQHQNHPPHRPVFQNNWPTQNSQINNQYMSRNIPNFNQPPPLIHSNHHLLHQPQGSPPFVNTSQQIPYRNERPMNIWNQPPPRMQEGLQSRLPPPVEVNRYCSSNQPRPNQPHSIPPLLPNMGQQNNQHVNRVMNRPPNRPTFPVQQMNPQTGQLPKLINPNATFGSVNRKRQNEMSKMAPQNKPPRKIPRNTNSTNNGNPNSIVGNRPPKSSNFANKQFSDNKAANMRTKTIKEVPLVDSFTVEKAEKPTLKPTEEEDEQTKELRLKIELQKKQREDFLRKKEERRKLQAAQRLAQIKARTGGTLPTKPPNSKEEPNVLNESLKTDIKSLKEKLGNLDPGTVKKKEVPVKPAVNDKPVVTKQTIVLKRKLIPEVATKPQPPPPKTFGKVLIGNLASTTSVNALSKLCKTFGPFKIQPNPKNKNFLVVFQTVEKATNFQQKYNRHMLDLSVMKVELVTPPASS